MSVMQTNTLTPRIQTIAMHIWHIFNGYEMRDEMKTKTTMKHIYSGQLIIIGGYSLNLFVRAMNTFHSFC